MWLRLHAAPLRSENPPIAAISMIAIERRMRNLYFMGRYPNLIYGNAHEVRAFPFSFFLNYATVRLRSENPPIAAMPMSAIR